jgi:hypothetical protein
MSKKKMSDLKWNASYDMVNIFFFWGVSIYFLNFKKLSHNLFSFVCKLVLLIFHMTYSNEIQNLRSQFIYFYCEKSAANMGNAS